MNVRIHKKLHTGEVNILPGLGVEVYMQVLEELKLNYIVVDYEADEAIVRIPNFYTTARCCPVMQTSQYIYNIRGARVCSPQQDKIK